MTRNQMSEKRPYRTPTLEEFGTVTDMTQVGYTHAGADVFPGNIPGHEGPEHPVHGFQGSIVK